MQKNGFIRKISSISKFMTSQAGYQTVTLHILLNISQSKGYQTMEFCQVIDVTREIFFFKNYAENETG